MSPISGKPLRSNVSVKSTTTKEEEEAEGGREEGMGGGRLSKGTMRWPQAFFLGRVLIEDEEEEVEAVKVEKRRRGFARLQDWGV